MMAIAFTILFQTLGDAYAYSRSNPGYVAVAWVTGLLFSVWLLLIVSFLPLVFPTGRLLSRRWRPVWWFSVATLATSIAAVALMPGRAGGRGRHREPARRCRAWRPPWSGR